MIRKKQIEGGGGATGIPLAAAYFDATGALSADLNYLADRLDAYQRPAVRDYRTGPGGRGAVSKLGAWTVDGDPQNVVSEGFVTYGANALGNGPSDALGGGFGFYEPNGFGLLNIIPGVDGGNTFYICGFEDGSVNAPFGLDGFIVNDNLAVPIAQIKRSDGTSHFREVDLYAPEGGAGARWRNGNGDPNGVVVGSVGDLWSRLDGGAGTALYVKESGAGTNTGWVGK
jgi:hypothetical protein